MRIEDRLRNASEWEEGVGALMDEAANEIERLLVIELAVRQLAYVVRKSVNSGPLSRDPTAEASAWRNVRMALGEGYDERGNLVPILSPSNEA